MIAENIKLKRLKAIQYTAIGFLIVAGIVNYLDRSALSIANSTIREELHLNASEMGLLLSAFSLAYAIAQLPVGGLLDRFGARVMLGMSMFIWSVAQLAGGLINSFHQFFIARILLGVGEAPQFPAGAKVVSEWFNPKERGTPTGIFVASSTIGPALAPPILTAMMLLMGWRWMFITLGILGIIVSVGWYLIYRNRSEVALTQAEFDHLSIGEDKQISNEVVKPGFIEWIRLFKHPTTWGLIFGFMGVIYMLWLYLTWLPGYLEHERGLNVRETGWIVSIPYIFATVGMLGGSWFADRLLAKGVAPLSSRKWLMTLGLVLAGAFTIPAAYTPNLILAIIFISAAMCFLNMASGLAWATVSISVPSRLVASLGSLMNCGGYLGGSIAPYVTGRIVDTTGSFVLALVVSAVVAIVAAIISSILIRNPIKETDIIKRCRS